MNIENFKKQVEEELDAFVKGCEERGEVTKRQVTIAGGSIVAECEIKLDKAQKVNNVNYEQVAHRIEIYVDKEEVLSYEYDL